MDAFELSRLDPATFEQLVNMLALRVLGGGATGFGPGADGGRDGWFEGEAPYPSEADRWSGTWYIQSKFHKQHLSKDPQKWLLSRIEDELKLFSDPSNDRNFPNNWIIATNIDPTGKPETGSFDKARALVEDDFPGHSRNFHIWGGSKIIALLTAYPEVASYYADMVTPGHVIASMYKKIIGSDASQESVVRDLVVTRFDDHQYTKLDQAGSDVDNRPGIHSLYTDLPYQSEGSSRKRKVAVDLAHASSLNHNLTPSMPQSEAWQSWAQHPKRSRVWFIKGGPGQGKSTSTQFLAQIHRAAIILGPDGPTVTPKQKDRAEEVKARAVGDAIWPLVPRVPVSIELRLFAQWFGARPEGQPKRIITYLAEQLATSIAQPVSIGDLRVAVSAGRWLFVFDGLDEVPGDVKGAVADEVTHFTNDWLISLKADAMVVCTSRPQGYSGQFDDLDHAAVNLAKLDVSQALACARPVLEIGRSAAESAESIAILEEASESATIREIMTTPLQAHIMAVVVRGGGRPPERKWQLFDNFYEVIKRREANRTLPNPALADMLRRDKLLKSLHARLGFELHSRAETSAGATTSIPKDEFKIIVKDVVETLQEDDIDSTVEVVMEATTDRLVLVNTPESGSFVRFDIRPLQEFFAAEYLYEAGSRQDLKDRLLLLARDSHWREVLHFYISALIEENRKPEIAVVIEVLQEVNERAFGEDSRLLSMRLALGAIQTSRVIEEGVLEEDRRVRADFQHCIAALCGCADALWISDEISPHRSKSWLKKLFLTALSERSESEALGAVLLLSRMVVDSEDEISQVTRYLDQGSIQLQKFVLQTLSARAEPWSEFPPLPTWLRVWALQLVSSENWRDLGVAVEAAYSIICSRDELPDEVIVRAGLPLEIAPTLRAIFRADRYIGQRRVHGAEELNFDMAGLGTLTLTESQLARDSQSWDDDYWTTLSRTSGVLQGCYLSLALHARANGVTATDLLDWARNDAEPLALLPDPVGPFVREHLAALAQTSGNVPFGLGYPGFGTSISIVSKFDVIDWTEAFACYPTLVAHVLFDPHRRAPGIPASAAEFLQTKASVAALENFIAAGFGDGRLIDIVAALRTYSPHHERLMSSISTRAALVKPGSYLSPSSRCDIKLPTDSVLLPHILPGVASQGSMLLRERDSSHAVGDRIRRELKERFSLDLSELARLREEVFANADQNLAAVALSAFETSDLDKITTVVRDILRLDWSGNDETIANILMLALSDGVMAGDERAWSAASAVLEHTRDNYEVRYGFNALLRRWRERTAAPVNDSLSSLAWH